METYEDEDYEEGFDEANENDGLDEMEKLKQAMNKEKVKAQKFNVLKGDGRKEEKSAQRPLENKMPGQKNLDGFSKQKGLIIGERVDHVAANR